MKKENQWFLIEWRILWDCEFSTFSISLILMEKLSNKLKKEVRWAKNQLIIYCRCFLKEQNSVFMFFFEGNFTPLAILTSTKSRIFWGQQKAQLIYCFNHKKRIYDQTGRYGPVYDNKRAPGYCQSSGSDVYCSVFETAQDKNFILTFVFRSKWNFPFLKLFFSQHTK